MTHSFPTLRSSDLRGACRRGACASDAGGGARKRPGGRTHPARELRPRLRPAVVRGHRRDWIGEAAARRVGLAGAADRVEQLRQISLPSRVDRKSTRLKLQSLMRISYAVFCLKKKINKQKSHT